MPKLRRKLHRTKGAKRDKKKSALTRLARSKLRGGSAGKYRIR